MTAVLLGVAGFVAIMAGNITALAVAYVAPHRYGTRIAANLAVAAGGLLGTVAVVVGGWWWTTALCTQATAVIGAVAAHRVRLAQVQARLLAAATADHMAVAAGLDDLRAAVACHRGTP